MRHSVGHHHVTYAAKIDNERIIIAELAIQENPKKKLETEMFLETKLLLLSISPKLSLINSVLSLNTSPIDPRNMTLNISDITNNMKNV